MMNPLMQAIAHHARLMLLVGIAIALGACSDESEPASPPQPLPASVAEAATHKIEWLKQTDGISPEQWLASREAGEALDRFDARVSEMDSVLAEAGRRFRDHTRMIANRAVQLEGMLREKSIEERAPRLIVTLSQVPGSQRYVESFASLTQQYYNLRTGGLSRADAIQALRQQVDARR